MAGDRPDGIVNASDATVAIPPGAAAAGGAVASEAETKASSAPPLSPSAVTRKLPERIGPFDVVRLLGRGGMGAVVEARDPRNGSRVAVKLIASESASDLDASARFDREGKVLRLLAHPHVVRYVDRGQADDGTQWIAMELVEGRSLADKLEKEGRLPIAFAAKVGRAVAEGLGYAHALGLVHRDVKPANVLLGERGEIKLADFGLARRRDESLAVTEAGTVVGTPLYMAPEQLDGQATTPASDLYALGAVLYHLIAGEPPTGDGSFAQIALRRARGLVAPLRDKRPDCPGALEALVHRLLAKRPEDRPSPTETARILATFEEDAPASAPPSSSGMSSSGTSSGAAVAPPADLPARDPRSLAAGVRVGPFTIEGRLGSGGMGSVFRARRDDGTAVALKFVTRPLDPGARQRFAREARALAEVEHPNVVRFLDAGESDGLSWIATELVPGRSLDALVQESGPLADERLLDVADAVAGALAALHAKGIVHRDVKPQNVMVAPDGAVKLVDLGLAKFLAGSSQTALTETGALVGTPHYMAPEQLLGKPVDARTDLYALGATLYHAATGKRPFDGETTTAVAFQQVHAAPVPVRRANPRIGGATAWLLGHLLEKSPERRPASAARVVELVAKVRRGETPTEAKQKLARAIGVLVLVLVVAGFVLSIFAPGVAERLGVRILADSRQARASAPVPTSGEHDDEGSKPAAPSASAQANAVDVAPRRDTSQPQKDVVAAEQKTESGAPAAVDAGGGGAGANLPAAPAPPAAKTRPMASSAGLAEGRTAPSEPVDLAKKKGAAAPRERALAQLGLEDLGSNTFRRTRDGATVILFAAGTYAVGSADAPRTVVLERALLVDRDAVSVAQWNAFAAFAERVAVKGHLSCFQLEPEGFEHATTRPGEASAAVRGLDVWDAHCYAAWVGARLPSGDEWDAIAGSGIAELGASGAEWTLDVKPDGAQARARGGRGGAAPAESGFRCVVAAPDALVR